MRNDMSSVRGKVLKIAWTRGDHSTLPGGVILRELNGEYVAHHFTRELGSLVPNSFFWGHYHSSMAAGSAAFAAKLEGVKGEVITKAKVLEEKQP